VLSGKRQLSYWKDWWAHQDSNLEPDRYEEWASSSNKPHSAQSAIYATH